MENKIEFNLELYNSGEYDVVTREGLPVKIAGVNNDAIDSNKIAGWVDTIVRWWHINGCLYRDGKSVYDLFLIPKKKIIKGWVNLYGENNILSSLILYKTKEYAIKNKCEGATGVAYIEAEITPTK